MAGRRVQLPLLVTLCALGCTSRCSSGPYTFGRLNLPCSSESDCMPLSHCVQWDQRDWRQCAGAHACTDAEWEALPAKRVGACFILCNPVNGGPNVGQIAAAMTAAEEVEPLLLGRPRG